MVRTSKRVSNNKPNGRKNSQSSMPTVPRIALGNRMCFGFPAQLLTKLRYVDNYALTSTVGSVAKQVFYLNSTFDPDNTGTGHQPLYRDTYASIYDHYAVTKTKIIAKFINIGSASASAIGIVVDDDNSTSSTVSTLAEQNLGRHVIISPISGSNSATTLTLSWDCKRDLGIDPFTSEEYKTVVGSNPTEVASLVAYSAPVDGASSQTVQLQVTMEMEVLWTELTTPTQS